MLTKNKLPIIIIFLFFMFTAGCDLFYTYERQSEIKYEYTSIQLYNEDGTQFKGNGKIYLYYTDIDGNIVEGFYADVTNGEYRRRYYYDDIFNRRHFKNIDPDPSINADNFFDLMVDTPPFFNYIPQDYNDSNISISISDLNDHVQNTNQKSYYHEYKFYNNDTPDEYKLLVNMLEKRNSTGYVTERLFPGIFVSFLPCAVNNSLRGNLKYTQELNDLRNNKKEKAEITINYDLYIGTKISEEELICFNHWIYTRAVYTIIAEEPDFIHYKTDVTVWVRSDNRYDKGDWSDYKTRPTLIDKNFRMRQ